MEAILAASAIQARIRSSPGSYAWPKSILPSAWKQQPDAALGARAYNCQSMDSILKNQLNRLPRAAIRRFKIFAEPREHPQRRLLRFHIRRPPVIQ